MAPPPAPLVHVNGFSGVGKEALAECLALLGREKSLLLTSINSVTTTQKPEPFTPEFALFISPETPTSATGDGDDDTLIQVLSHPAHTSRIAILPVCAPNTPAGRSALHRIKSTAAQRGRIFVSVALTYKEAKHMRRAHSLQRQYSFKYHKRMRRRRTRSLASIESLTGMVGTRTDTGMDMDLREKRLASVRGPVTVDITRVSVSEAALQIVKLINRLVAEREKELCGGAVTTPREG